MMVAGRKIIAKEIMRLTITAKVKSRKAFVEQINDKHYLVAVKESPQDNQANEAIIKSLAKYFKIASSQITIISGHKYRRKIIDVN